ncbi:MULTISPECIES: TraH family protein [Sinorhizobium]|uniref:Conjugal transfer protein TraH n=1 Tax=Sinorhizobium americanum TaxID=194963 RepID=A0A2S3YUF8_9HYPH|nr:MULTISPECIES: TraH family protein [Sinorhizobium]PDT39335.1 conjugal transfer protein TraH [Sinorhizobium sp. FG01]PDT50728.1 conjugal transfer protein TraH [Sinorhizobium sp. NG07B]POH34069.1 conjugal transfer protein TraH [Sinorhizobium americanum]POH35266.1 conjugal transfer protein TraH [Sinorhizobium americanum]
MLDAALIQQCADPSLKPAIVEQFVTAAGANDPLAVTVKSGGRLILVPKATSPDEAMAIIRQYVGQTVVRVGLTQFPAGVGVKDAADLKPDLVDPCENLRKGTSMFAQVLRIVAKWYGNPKSDDVFPQIFDDAVYAWKTGEFEGVSVFQAEDPGKSVTIDNVLPAHQDKATVDVPPPDTDAESIEKGESVGSAEMRIDLSRIGGK